MIVFQLVNEHTMKQWRNSANYMFKITKSNQDWELQRTIITNLTWQYIKVMIQWGSYSLRNINWYLCSYGAV